jgi:uncharacterized protein (DUF1330 family)
MIGSLSVKDWAWYREYRSIAEPLIAEYGGTYLVKGGGPATLEGDRPCDAIVLVSFPDRDTLERWYNDERYAPARALRQEGGVTTDLWMVDGEPLPG